jgi:hypothetical protein
VNIIMNTQEMIASMSDEALRAAVPELEARAARNNEGTDGTGVLTFTEAGFMVLFEQSRRAARGGS